MGSAQVPCEALNLHTEEGRWMTLGESAVREAGKFFAWPPCRCGKVEQRLRWLQYINCNDKDNDDNDEFGENNKEHNEDTA